MAAGVSRPPVNGGTEVRKAPKPGDMNRAVRTSLLNAAPILVLYPFFRFCVLPLFPQVDELLAGALAGGAAGVAAIWLVRLFRRS